MIDIINTCLISLFLLISASPSLEGCGITVHNEVTYRSLENFMPNTTIEEAYKNDMLESPSFTQAGSFFPDWGYQCLGYSQQSEDAHWPAFIKTAVNYVRNKYPADQFHTDKNVRGLISFIFAIMSHGMADVKWHSLSSLSDYFVVAMANSDFHSNRDEAHTAADTGAEFALRHSSKLSYLNETWQVPIKDIIEIYKQLYRHEKSSARIPLESHLQYCMATAFAATKVDVELGQLMYGIFGSKSPFLTEELYDYNRGGIVDMSGSVSDCYPELIQAFENGVRYGYPDTLCASYFVTGVSMDSRCRNVFYYQQGKKQETIDSWAQYAKNSHFVKPLSTKGDNPIYQHYDQNTGIFTITLNRDNLKDHQPPEPQDSLSPIVIQLSNEPIREQDTEETLGSGTKSPKKPLHFQKPFFQPNHGRWDPVKNAEKTKPSTKYEEKKALELKKCISLDSDDELYMDVTLSVPVSSAKVGHQIALGDFNGNGYKDDIAISAPYYYSSSNEQLGSVFILNNYSNIISSLSSAYENQDLREISNVILQGNVNHGRFGWSMLTLDINKDNIDDLIISTPFNNGHKVEIYFGIRHFGLSPQPSVQIQFQSQDALLGTVLAGIDMDQDGYKDLLVGCPLCSIGNQPQVGVVYVFKSRDYYDYHGTQEHDPLLITDPDITIDNPNLNQQSCHYDHFGDSISLVKDTILIGAPGYSTGEQQRVGRVYAFDIVTKKLKWIMTGTKEFQQFGRVIETDKDNKVVAISSPSEETEIALHKYWQGGAVRIYDWSKLDPDNNVNTKSALEFDMQHGMISIIKGRSKAGHLGQSMSFFDDDEQRGIWIGEPMSEKENGRVYRWLFNENNDVQCIKNSQAALARFGSQIGPLGTEAICITSQRYGQNARYPGAVTFLQRAKYMNKKTNK